MPLLVFLVPSLHKQHNGNVQPLERASEEYSSKIATCIKEAKELVDSGFEFVCDFGTEGKLFGKRK